MKNYKGLVAAIAAAAIGLYSAGCSRNKSITLEGEGSNFNPTNFPPTFNYHITSPEKYAGSNTLISVLCNTPEELKLVQDSFSRYTNGQPIRVYSMGSPTLLIDEGLPITVVSEDKIEAVSTPEKRNY